MTHLSQPPPPIESETRQLYLHLLNLKRADGGPATDRSLLHREVAKSPECKAALLDAGSLERYCSGDQAISADQLAGLRDVLDRAHREVVDPRFTWKPRWLDAPQNSGNAHPSIARVAI
jgi:hypothetical protein